MKLGVPILKLYIYICIYIYSKIYLYISKFHCLDKYVYIYTREIPAFGGISLPLRGSGALSATFRKPPLSAVVKEKK